MYYTAEEIQRAMESVKLRAKICRELSLEEPTEEDRNKQIERYELLKKRLKELESMYLLEVL